MEWSLFCRGKASDASLALAALSEAIDLACTETEFSLLRLTAKILRKRQPLPAACNIPTIAARLLQNEPIRVVFVNDNGVHAGAGIGLKRQAQAFAQAGHEIHIIALNSDDHMVTQCFYEFRTWLDANDLNVNLHLVPKPRAVNCSGQFIFTDFFRQFTFADGLPTLYIVGNLHSWPISPGFIPWLMSKDIAFIFYAHDLDWISGGCAYPQYYDCTRYLSQEGCTNQSCPMPDHAYPTSARRRKTANYAFRDIVISTNQLPIVTNSSWTTKHFQARYPECQLIHEAEYGLDTDRFFASKEIYKSRRRRLNLPESTLAVAIGADDDSRPGKGSHHLKVIMNALAEQEDIVFLSFGHSSLEGANIIKFGYSSDERRMASVFQCADIFLNMATIDCFGQVTIEAASCGCVPIVLAGTGTEAAVENHRNGIVVADIKEAIRVISHLAKDRRLLSALSESAAEYTQNKYSLGQEYIRWIHCLSSIGARSIP
ncbi:MAG: glycosyltransferase [Cyanobium sp.]